MYTIDHNVPISPRKKVYPFSDMRVGDSFSFPESKKKTITSHAWCYARNKNIKFSVRGCRIWRVK
jgi:hypothetical protein